MNDWAGHYPFNLLDRNAIAELLVYEEHRVLDLSAFRFERFAEGALVKKINVVSAKPRKGRPAHAAQTYRCP